MITVPDEYQGTLQMKQNEHFPVHCVVCMDKKEKKEEKEKEQTAEQIFVFQDKLEALVIRTISSAGSNYSVIIL